MKKWEYKEEHWGYLTSGDLLPLLNAEGKHGWELVALGSFQEWGIFKRQPPGVTKGWT